MLYAILISGVAPVPVCLDEKGGDIVDLEPDRNDSAEDVNLIIEKVKKEKSVPEIAEALERDEASVARCVEIVSWYAPEYDLETILDEVLYGKKTDK